MAKVEFKRADGTPVKFTAGKGKAKPAGKAKAKPAAKGRAKKRGAGESLTVTERLERLESASRDHSSAISHLSLVVGEHDAALHVITGAMASRWKAVHVPHFPRRPGAKKLPKGKR